MNGHNDGLLGVENRNLWAHNDSPKIIFNLLSFPFSFFKKEELFLREERHLNRVENHTELETPPASVCRVPIGLDAVEQGIHRASEHATENYLKREKSLLR